MAVSESRPEPKTEANTSSQGPLEFERFAIYGFSVDYPVGTVVELNPKSTRDDGDVAFKYHRANVFFLNWGPLAKVEKFQGVEGHASYSMDRIRKNRDAKIKDHIQDTIKLNGHSSPFNHVWVNMERRGALFGVSKSSHEIRSIHVHCTNSSRYFMIYVQGATELSELQGAVMDRMIQTFRCH